MVAGIPFSAVKAFIKSPQIKQALTVKGTNYTAALIEILRSRVTNHLRDFFMLRKTKCNTLTIGKAFPQEITSLIKDDLGIKTRQLPVKYGARINQDIFSKKITLLISQQYFLLHLLLTDPISVLKAIRAKVTSPPKKLNKADILIFSNGLHLASYHSAIRQLARKYTVTVITDKQSLEDAFHLAQYSLKTAEANFTANQKNRELVKIHQQVVNQLQDALKKKSVKLRVRARWIKPQTVKKLIEQILVDKVNRWLPTFLTKHLTAQQILESTRPKLLITTHDPGPSALAFVLPAKKRKISTLLLLHGSPSKDLFFFSDKQIIWGKTIKRFLVNHGNKAHRLILGGQPIFYDYKLFLQKHKNKTSNKINLAILTSGYGHNEVNQVEYFLKLFPELSQINQSLQISIRTHAQQYIDGLKQLARNHGLSVKINPAQLLEEFIGSSNIIITQNSTAGLLGPIGNKPTIYLSADHSLQNKGSLISSRALFYARSAPEAKTLIEKIISNRSWRDNQLKRKKKYLLEYTGPISKTIGQETAQKIIELIK